MDLFPKILDGYGVTPNFAEIDKTFAEIYALVWKLDAEIKAVEVKAAKTGETVVHPFDAKATKDKVAAGKAAKILSDFLASIADVCENEPHVAYWLAQDIKGVSQFLTSEVQYARRVTDRKAPVAKREGSNDSKRADRKELVVFLRTLYGMVPALQSVEMEGVRVKDGTIELPSLKGRANGSTSDSALPTGRYAGAYSTLWTVDDESFPLGSDPLLVIRTIWTGKDRVGKKLADLWDAFDKAGGSKATGEGKTVTLKLNGKTVTGRKPAEEEE